jgi:hypothetical protein
MAGPPGFAAGVTSGFVAGAAAGCISGMLSQVYNEIILPSDNLSQDAAFNNGLMSGMIAGTTAGAVAAAAEVSNLPAIGKCTQLKRSETRFKNIAFTKTSVNATMQATAAYLTSDGDLGYVTLSALLSISATHLELVAEEVSGTSAAGVILGIEFGFINAIGENYLYLFRDFR